MISGVTCSVSSKIPLRQLSLFLISLFSNSVWNDMHMHTNRMISFLNNYSEVYDDTLQVGFH